MITDQNQCELLEFQLKPVLVLVENEKARNVPPISQSERDEANSTHKEISNRKVQKMKL